MDATQTAPADAQPAEKHLPAVFTYLNDEIAAGEGKDVQIPSLHNLTGFVKRYRTGGENTFHTHLGEDHYFFILSGEATFRIEVDENEVVVPKGDGILIPRGTHYRFQSSGGDNKLIMLRVANESHVKRFDPTGKPTVSTKGAGPNPKAPTRDLPFLSK